MANSAGGVTINLSLNSASYTKGLTQAQREMTKFVSGTKHGMHGSVTDVQAVSASLRSLHGGFEQNLRSMERWVAQSKTATKVAQVMFPLVGAGTFTFMVGEIVVKVADFIEKANKMPKAIEMGFASLQLASQSSIDSLRLTNDQLENSIAKLEGKPQNNLAIQFDEAAKAADKLATSIESGNNKLNELLSKNHLSGWAILTGKMGTADREGTLKYFGDQQDSNAYDLADATSRGDKSGIAKAQAALKATQSAELASLRGDLSNRQANSHNPGALNDSANINIDKGAIAEILKQQQEEAEEVRNAGDSATKARLDAQKADAEAAKKAAHDRVAAMQTALDAMKLQYSMSIKATYDFWEIKKSTELAGGTAYNDIVKKQAELAVQAAAKAHETIVKAIADAKRSNGQDATTGPDLINQSARFMQQSAAKTSADGDSEARDSNQLDMDRASTTARLQEAQITDAAGDSMTRYAAAVAIADVHAKELKDTLFDLKANIDIAQRAFDTATDPEARRQARHALTQAKNAYSNTQTSGAIEAIRDNQATDPGFTSATTGATDALNEFVMASRDSAAMMRDLASNTLHGLNQQIVGAMSGQRTNFGSFGASVFRSVAGTALDKGEGELLGAFGGGKLGASQSNPMWVKVAGSSGSASAASSMFSSMAGGSGGESDSDSGSGSSAMGTFAGVALQMLPMLATGGPIDGPAIVGEAGPELYVPHTSGTIIPNHKLSALGGGGHTFNINVDAKGSTDPAQTRAQVMRGIQAAAPQIVASSLSASAERNKRKPPTQRK